MVIIIIIGSVLLRPNQRWISYHASSSLWLLKKSVFKEIGLQSLLVSRRQDSELETFVQIVQK